MTTLADPAASALSMEASTNPQWSWHFLPPLSAAAFEKKPDIPLLLWAQQNVFLDRRMTTRPGHPDPAEYPWTWEFGEIIRLRHVWEKQLDDGAIVIVDPGTEGATCERVHQADAMKCTQSGLTEVTLHGIRYIAKHDPQNVGFAIDNVKQAGEVNEIRLKPTLRKLGADVMPADDDDAGRYLIRMRRMLIYFLGSYSSGAFAQKMFEIGINDELEEHGTKNSVEDMKSRMKTSARRLLINISRPKKLLRNNEGKIIGGPIALEHAGGSMHVQEVPCPHCTEQNGGVPAGFQELQQDNMKFGHCKNVLEEWDLDRVLTETYFECIHCHQPIEEHWKRWMNDRKNRRWRRTNLNAEPNHISFHFSDFLAYDDSVRWGRLAIKYIKSAGNSEKRASYRNDHEGLPVEVIATRTEISDLLLLRGTYKRGFIPWEPRTILLIADVGQVYVKWGVLAFRKSADWGDGECSVIDWGKDIHPDDIARRFRQLKYKCIANRKRYGISFGDMDARFRRLAVHKACLRVPRLLFPSVGLRAGISSRSVSINRNLPNRPAWFGVITYNDDDAKSELYADRFGAWAEWLKNGQPADEKPLTARIWLPEDIKANPGYESAFDAQLSRASKKKRARSARIISKRDNFLEECTREHLVEDANGRLEWKRKGDNEAGDILKVGCLIWRFFNLGEDDDTAESGNKDAAAELQEAIGTEDDEDGDSTDAGRSTDAF